MSTQPSQYDTAKNKASDLHQSVVAKVQGTEDPKVAEGQLTKDTNGQTVKKGSFRDQLNQASKAPLQQKQEETLFEKVCSYVPGVGSSQKAPSNQELDKGDTKDDGTPPTRPENDVQVEEFLRGQYKTAAKKEESTEGTKK